MGSLDQNEAQQAVTAPRRGQRWGIVAALIAIAFLIGFVPMWMKARERTSERDTARAALRSSTLQNTLADAAVDTRRGRYEPARKAASQFFTNLQAELDRGENSVFNEAQRSSLRSAFANRDEVITLLARSDASALDRLAAIYDGYRQASQTASQHQ